MRVPRTDLRRASDDAHDRPTEVPASPVDDRLPTALDQARDGDQQGFAVLYRALHPRLLRYASSLVGQDGEDVVAEAWLQIARDLRGFVGDYDGFRGWAATVVRNRAMDHVRFHSRRPATAVDVTLLDGYLASEDTAAAAEERVTTARALAMIATLPADQAEAVLLRVVVGLDAREAGKVLGKRAGAVRVAAHRGLKRLARELEDQDRGANQADRGSAR